MPKMKTNRSAAKRFKLTGGGKIKRKRSGRRHILFDKTTKLKRHLRGNAYVSDADEKRILRILGKA